MSPPTENTLRALRPRPLLWRGGDARARLLHFVDKQIRLPANSLPLQDMTAPRIKKCCCVAGGTAAKSRTTAWSEIAVKSHYLALGYWRRPEVTQTVFEAGPTMPGARLLHGRSGAPTIRWRRGIPRPERLAAENPRLQDRTGRGRASVARDASRRRSGRDAWEGQRMRAWWRTWCRHKRTASWRTECDVSCAQGCRNTWCLPLSWCCRPCRERHSGKIDRRALPDPSIHLAARSVLRSAGYAARAASGGSLVGSPQSATHRCPRQLLRVQGATLSWPWSSSRVCATPWRVSRPLYSASSKHPRSPGWLTETALQERPRQLPSPITRVPRDAPLFRLSGPGAEIADRRRVFRVALFNTVMPYVCGGSRHRKSHSKAATRSSDAMKP